MNAGMMPYL